MREIQSGALRYELGEMFRSLDAKPDEVIALTTHGKVRAIVLSSNKFIEMGGTLDV
jgi:hypothetical protein